jgi:hypothetical protein
MGRTGCGDSDMTGAIVSACVAGCSGGCRMDTTDINDGFNAVQELPEGPVSSGAANLRVDLEVTLGNISAPASSELCDVKRRGSNER